MCCYIVRGSNIFCVVSQTTITPLTPAVKASKLLCTQSFSSFLFSHHTVQVLQFTSNVTAARSEWQYSQAATTMGSIPTVKRDLKSEVSSRLLFEIKKWPCKFRHIKQKRYLLYRFCIYVMVLKHHTERCFSNFSGV